MIRSKGPCDFWKLDAERLDAGGEGVGGGADGRGDCHGTGHKQFFINPKPKQFLFYFLKVAFAPTTDYCAAMSFYSMPFTPERVEATEARLEAIYAAARYGLKGDSLALRAGLTPAQYRKLHEFDPLVEIAEMKGRADGEFTAAKTMHDAAAAGDAKAALDILKHQHGWKAAQSLEITVEGQISVIGALERAQTRVIEGLYTEVPQLEDNTTHASANLLSRRGNGVDGPPVVIVD
jgi:hypothetical protein